MEMVENLKSGTRTEVGYPAEIELLSRSIFKRPDEEIRNIFRKKVAEVTDWNRLISIAEFHGIKPIFYYNLKQYAADLVSEPMKRKVDNYFQLAHLHSHFQLQESEKIVTRFQESSIDVLLLKGPTLAQRIYGDINLRKSNDIDIFISHEKIDTADQILSDMGYTQFSKIADLSSFGKRTFLWIARQFPYKKNDGLFNLDVHTAIMPPGYSSQRDFNTYFERSDRIQIGSKILPVLGIEDLLEVLSYHGNKNRWEKIKYFSDIAALIHSNPNLDWEKLILHSRKTESRRIVLQALFLANKVCNVRLPDKISNLIDSKVSDGKLEPIINQIKTEPTSQGLTWLQRLRFYLNAQNTLKQKFNYVKYSITRMVWAFFYARKPERI
ncbi:MAG: hypothetical protein GF372_15115 [Candidatus Marinimicrobia bacterium]|nr:hypothetical protein [Candidatus Neomarinimicrobiota bacterium]